MLADPVRVLVEGHDHVGEEAEVLRRSVGLAFGLRDWQARVEGLEFGQVAKL